MVKRNISFYKGKVCAEGKVHIMNFLDKGNVEIIDSWE